MLCLAVWTQEQGRNEAVYTFVNWLVEITALEGNALRIAAPLG